MKEALTGEERREIEAEARHYRDKRAACVEALKIVQRRRRWVSDECLKEVALVLDMAPEDLEAVATFYNLIFRKPVGKHVILICDSVTCWIMGYERVREHLTSRLGIRLGETTADDRFTMLPMPCLGTCDHAPAMMVDHELYQDLDPQKIDQVIERFKDR